MIDRSSKILGFGILIPFSRYNNSPAKFYHLSYMFSLVRKMFRG